MVFSKQKLIFTGFIVLLFVFFLQQIVLADTESDNVTINATVPAVCGNFVVEAGEECDDGNLDDGDGCSSSCEEEGGGGPGDSWSPVISNIVEDVSASTAGISWDATDAHGIRVCYFDYGLDTSYSESGSVFGSYEVFLTGLDTETEYFYRIKCLDNNFNEETSTGSFTTLAGPDSEAPVISNISIEEDITSSTITWQATDNVGVQECSLVYDDDNGLEPFDNTGTVNNQGGDNYDVNLLGLTPSTDYYYKITCVDATPNDSSATGSFTTLVDTTPPPDVSNFNAAAGDTEVALTWDYTDSISDFYAFVIVRGLSEPTDINDGDRIATITDINTNFYTDSGLNNLTEYFYKIFAVDSSDNNSNGVWDSAIPHTSSEAGLCADNLDNDLDGNIDCADNDCSADVDCQPDIEICNNLEDDDFDGDVDCDDSDCVGSQFCEEVVVDVEICDDNLDNDNDGAIDCADSDCECQEPESEIPECSDNTDNDQDGFIDLEDPGCTNADDNDEFNEPIPNILPEERIDLQNIEVWLSERTVQAVFLDRTVSTLSGDQITILISAESLADRPVVGLSYYLNSDVYNFVYNPVDNIYSLDIVAPRAGTYESIVEVRYEEQITDTLNFFVRTHNLGQIQDKRNGNSLEGVEVKLVRPEQGDRIWSAENYRQENPQVTNSFGAYGYVVPIGTYKLIATKNQYRVYESQPFYVGNNVINRNFELIYIPPKLEEVIDEDAALIENVGNVARNISEKATAQVAVLQELSDDPKVEEATKKVAAPAVLTVSLAAVMPSLWSIVLPLLRFLFLQPLLLLGRRRRKRWGIVYNSYSKLPIDLAVVRLLDAATGKVVRSRVTDKEGRYLFIVDPGEYRIQVIKQDYVFPSEILKEVKTDRELVDLYHGEKIKVTEQNVSLTPNIPIDPADVKKTPRRIKWEKRFRVLQHIISIAGIVATIISLYISPTWYLWVFLGIHLLLYSLFFIYVKPKKPKGWGIIYDKNTNKPIGKVMVRLFTKDYNKLVASQVTDTKGRYSFLVGPNDYYITYQKPGYKPVRSDDISMKKGDKGIIIKDQIMEKQ
ncbi:MAG: hypothetical protein GF349_01850 [Candidatus Magasanikbacteria bacterium]|nr:hypothetical protein [Candidatus Magasanikbacteria bacterium]